MHNNRITIDGGTELAFTEDVAKRFDAYCWHVQNVEDGNDLDFENHRFRWCARNQSSRRGVDEISMLLPENADHKLYRKVVATDFKQNPQIVRIRS